MELIEPKIFGKRQIKRNINIDDSTYEILKRCSELTGNSISSFIRQLIWTYNYNHDGYEGQNTCRSNIKDID